MKVYDTYEEAVERVEQLKQHGIWPGIIQRADGRYQLTRSDHE